MKLKDLEPIELLLVEDNMDEASMAIRELNKHNLANHLLHVKDGEEALEYIFGKGRYEGRNVNDIPNVILLDLKMPKVDGIEVLREIRADERTRKIPVVVLTSSQEEKDITDAYDLGVNSYIVKPIDFENFSNSIKEIGLYWLVLNKV
ncbi:MAG: response regulator [Candidatus Delongbacteria bacterium]|nr:response regulator [Candidatus Delongbacteria bacterium]